MLLLVFHFFHLQFLFQQLNLKLMHLLLVVDLIGTIVGREVTCGVLLKDNGWLNLDSGDRLKDYVGLGIVGGDLLITWRVAVFHIGIGVIG